jgi:predicted Zn finger-like uncharacterized protein
MLWSLAVTEYGARCPGCNISFRITGAQRRAAGGLVRCGFCLLPFDANAHGVALTPEPVPAARPWRHPDTDGQLEQRIDTDPQARSTVAAESRDGTVASIGAPPAQSGAPEPEIEARDIAPPSDDASCSPALPSDAADPEPEPRADLLPDAGTDAAPASVVGAPPVQSVAPEPEIEASEIAPPSDDASCSPALPSDAAAPEHRTDLLPDAGTDAAPASVVVAPSPAAPPWLEPRAAPARTGAAAAIVIGALVTLLLQGLYFHADRLDQRPELRGFYGILCRVAPCRQPVYRDLAAIAVDQLMVRNQAPGALRLDAMLTNRGRAAQPLPRVRLWFENLQGTVVAERRFAPAEYLDQPTVGVLAVGQSLHLVLELVDPGPEAVSYALAPVD